MLWNMKNIIYTSGVFDLLHASHVRALKAAKAQLQFKNVKLIVGVATDEDTQAYKRKPVIPYEQRVKMIESLDFVDKVITAPLFTSEQFYKFYGITMHVQGEDDAGEIDYYKGGKDIGIMSFIGRDPIESTTSCISKLIDIVGQDFKVEPLHGGISNMTWKVSSLLLSKKYVLKYLQASSVESFSLRHDCIILGGTFALYEYIDGLVGHVTSKEMVSFFLENKKNETKLLKSGNLELSEKNIFPSLMKYTSHEIEDKLKELNFYKEIFKENRDWCWCHNDLVRENIINTTNGIKFIDWEYAEIAPLEMDIASCVINDVIDYSDVPSEIFDMKFLSLLIIFQGLIWIQWYKTNASKWDDSIVAQYKTKINKHMKILEIKDV